jgi:hypothetical protein
LSETVNVLLVEAVQQFGRCLVEREGEIEDGEDAWLSDAALEHAHLPLAYVR